MFVLRSQIYEPGYFPRNLHVVLREAVAERGVVVGLARLGLDGRLVPQLSHLRRLGHGPDAAHHGVVVRPVRHQVRLLAAEEGAKGLGPPSH